MTGGDHPGGQHLILLAERLGMAEVVRVDRELLEQGFALFQSRPDKEWSLTDCFATGHF